MKAASASLPWRSAQIRKIAGARHFWVRYRLLRLRRYLCRLKLMPKPDMCIEILAAVNSGDYKESLAAQARRAGARCQHLLQPQGGGTSSVKHPGSFKNDINSCKIDKVADGDSSHRRWRRRQRLGCAIRARLCCSSLELGCSPRSLAMKSEPFSLAVTSELHLFGPRHALLP